MTTTATRGEATPPDTNARRLLAGDTPWLVAMAAASAVLFAVTLTGHLPFGDGAESVAGVRTVGILHAPGYPAYVLVAKLFTIVEPFGSLTLRLGLFSAICSSAAVVVTFVIARRLGAGRLGAVAAGATLAAGQSFWFYAGYAKPYAVTSLVIAVLILLALDFEAGGGTPRLVAIGVLGGLATGLSYQVVALCVPGIAILLLAGRTPPRLRQLAWATVAFAGTTLAVGLFAMVRASSHPLVSWGDADSPGRLLELFRMKDFGFLTGGVQSGLKAGRARVRPSGGSRFIRYPLVLLKDLGPVALLLAAVGVTGSLARRRDGWVRPVALAVIFLTNAAGVMFLVIKGGSTTVQTSFLLATGGFFLGANLVAAIWTSLGVTALASLAASNTRRARSRAASRRAGRRGQARPATPWAAVIAISATALVVVTPLATHRQAASHRMPPFAEQYADNVFTSLPKNAVLIVWNTQRSFPLLATQAQGRRTDVTLVFGQQIVRPWYRRELSRRLDLKLTAQPAGNWYHEMGDIAHKLQGRRPVFFDVNAAILMQVTKQPVGYRELGLIAELADGTGPQQPDIARWKALMDRYETSGLDNGKARRRWPNAGMLVVYGYAHADLAAWLVNTDKEAAKQEVLKALRVDPKNDVARAQAQKLGMKREDFAP